MAQGLGITDQEHRSDCPLRLLIADDHSATRALVRRILASSGATFAEACDGNEAVSLFDTFEPDWTIMDISMPGMDGLAATATIHSQHPDARIIIVTQHDSRAMRERAFECGASEFLPKTDLTRLPALVTSN